MSENRVILYEPGKKSNLNVLIDAKVNDNGDLIIGEYDFSSSASETFGSDIEINIRVKKNQKKKLINILNITYHHVSDDTSLLNWLQEKYNTITALSDIESLLKSNTISYGRTRWP